MVVAQVIKDILQELAQIKRLTVRVDTQMAKELENEEEEELGYVYHHNLRRLIWKTCFLIDSKSGVDILNNNKYLTKIHKAKKPLKLHCDEGCVQVNHKGLFGRIEVWYYPKGIAHPVNQDSDATPSYYL